jgi:succinate-acetate transporter protein
MNRVDGESTIAPDWGHPSRVGGRLPTRRASWSQQRFAVTTFFAGEIPAAHVGDAVGLCLTAWGIFTTYMFVASLRTTGAVAAVFFLLAVTFFLLGIGNSGENTGVVEAGGWTGLATAVAAWYASFAAVTNSTFGRTVLPVRPLGR